jgi:transmembrane sensor
MTQEFTDLRLLAKYLDGTATDPELAQVRAWIGDDPERAAAVAQLAHAWTDDRQQLGRPYDADAAFARVAAKLPDLHGAGRYQRRARRVRGWRVPMLAAASILVTVVAGNWALGGRARTDAAPEARAEREYRTQRGQRAVVHLSDGTVVTLNAESRLVVAHNFGTGRRPLFLEGEAFFDVAHDTLSPFTVRTTRGTARDIGTKFAVRSYADDARRELQVVVAEGVVAIAAPAGTDSLVIRAAQSGHVTESGELRADHDVDVRALLGWTEGRLEFDNTPLREVLPVLARWYDVKVRVDDPRLAEVRVTAVLSGERFDEATAGIARIVNARVVRRNDETVLVRIP